MKNACRNYYRIDHHGCTFVGFILNPCQTFLKGLISLVFVLVISGCKENSSSTDSKKLTGTYPYFASLKTGKVNGRMGPGKSYQVAWTYMKAPQPVEVLAEYDHWYKVKDVDESETWVKKSFLSKNRSGYIKEKQTFLREAPDAEAFVLADVREGVIVDISHCSGTWCTVKVEGYKGYIAQNTLYGTYQSETF